METPSKSVGDVFAESLRREQEAAEAAMAPATEYAEDYNPFVTEDDPEALVDSLWNTSLPLLKDQYDSTPEGNKRNAIKFVLSDKTNKFLDELAAQPGYENRVRFLAQKKRDREIDQRFVDASMGLMVEAAKQPPAELSGKDLSAAVDSIDPIFGDLVDGLYGVATYSLPAAVEAFKSIPVESYFPLGMGTALAARKIDKLLGVERPPEKIEETPNINLLVTAAQQSNYETVRLLQRFGRLYALSRSMDDPKKFAEYFSEDKVRKRVNDDLKMYDTMIALERGQADMIGPDGKPTGETKQVVRPEDVPLIQPVGEILGAENFAPGLAGAKVASLPLREAAETVAMRLTTTAARQLERRAAEKAVRESVSLPRQVVGTAVEMTGRGAEKIAESPVARGIVGAGAAVATGGAPTTVLLTTIGAGTKAGKQAATFFPKMITRTGEFIKKPVTGPFKAMADYVTDVGKAGLAGTATMIPPALIAETPEERGSLLAGGLVYGAAGGGAERARTGIRNSISDFGRSFFKPDQTVVSESQRVAPTNYGIPNLDAAHAAYVAEMPADQANRVEALRDLIGRKNKLFVLSPDQFDSLVPQQGEKAPEGVRAAGVAIRNNADGTSTAYVRGGSESLFHETGHVIFNSLPEATKKDIRDSVLDGYTQPELQQMLDYYTTRGIDVPNLNSLIDEIIAENYQVALNGGPLGRLGTPLGLAGRIYSSIGALAERVGVRSFVPGTDVVTSSVTRFTPSFIVNNAIRNGFEAMRLDEAGTAAVPEIVGTPEAAPAAEVAPAEAPAAAPEAPVAVPAAEAAPEAPAAAPVAPVEAPTATPEAQDLINKIDGGGASPAFISRNLERIANENGVEVTPQMTPKDVIDALREKTTAPAPAEAPVEAPAAAPEAAPEAAVAPAPVEAAAAPTPAPAVPPNVRNVTEARRARFVQPTEQQVEANRQKLAQMASRPRGQQEYVEVDYLSAVSDEKSPNAEIRREQRALADAAEQETPGYTNPLRAVFQKVFAPYRVGDTPNTVYGFSFDKLVQNVDILSGWLRRNQDAAAQINLPYPLTSPQLAADVNTYLRNQSNGYGGDGTRLTRPADAVGITPENPNYTPVRLTRPVTNLINMLMGLEPAQKLTKNEEFNLRFAELNGLIPERTKKGGIEPNPLRNQFRQAGFNTKLLNGVLENLRVDRIGANVVSRPDLALPVGEGAFTRIGFMLESNAATPESFTKENIPNLGNVTGWAVLTAENPNAQQLPVAENRARMIALTDQLRKSGYQFESVRGKYGNEENSLLVYGITPEEARQIGQQYGQESVLVPQGLLFSDGSKTIPATGFSPLEADADDFFSEIRRTGQKFVANLDFENPIEAGAQTPATAPTTMEQAGEDFFSQPIPVDQPEPPTTVQYMLEDEKLLPKNVQFKQSKRTGSVGGVIPLVHFSSVEYRNGVLNPKKTSGKGAATATDLRGLQRGYFYKVGTQYEAQISSRPSIYSAVVDGNAIYDLNSDPLGYGDIINREKADQMLVDEGFVGMRGKVGPTEMVAIFKPIKVEEATPEEVFSQRALAARRRQAREYGAQYMFEDTPEFKKWFGKSKVIDENGKPLVVYHGPSASRDFNVFDDDLMGWFTTDKNTADSYIQVNGVKTIGAYLKIENPLDLTDKVHPDDLRYDISERKSEWLKQGYDGVRIVDSRTPDEVHWVPFKPEQIKSATGNTGAFNPENPDIRFMLEDTPEETPEAPLANETLPIQRGPLNPPKNTAMGIIYTDNAELKAPEGGQAIGGVARMLGKAAIEENGRRISSKDITVDEEDRLAGIVADEAEAGLKKKGNAGDWYTAAIKRTLVVARQMFKELTDPAAAKAAGFSTIKDAELALMIAFATTSQNLDVADNTRYAIEQFESLLSTGEYDPSKKYGTKGKAISANLRLANTLVKTYGWPGLRRFVAKDFTVGQLSKVASDILGKKVSIEGYVDDTVQGAAIFGPKIGQGFLQNLLGRFDPVTVDLWLRRTWGRLTGDIMPESIKPEQLAKWLDSFREAGIELPPELNDIPVITRTRRTGQKSSYRTVDEARFAQFLESPTAQKALEDINDVEAKRWQDAYSDLRMPMSPALAEEIRNGTKSLMDAVAEIRSGFDQREAAWNAYLEDARAQNIPAKQRKKKDKFFEELDAQEGRTATLSTDELSNMKPEWAKSAAVAEKLTKPIDAPTALDRKKITAVLGKALVILAQRGINLTNADLQATIWYPEKDIWERLSTGKEESSLKLSYDTELLKIADARGKGDAARAAIRKARIGQR